MPSIPKLTSSAERVLSGFDIEKLEQSSNSICAITDDYRLVYFNRGWEQFARANQGEQVLSAWPPGRSVLEACSESVKELYSRAFRQVQATHRPWEHVYHCGSPALYRRFRMRVVQGRREGLIVVHSLIVERPYSGEDWEPKPPGEETYCDENGLIRQCADCRRVRRPGPEAIWDWVPDYVTAQPDRISHGLCEICLERFRRELGLF